jgi:hypothetical protein
VLITPASPSDIPATDRTDVDDNYRRALNERLAPRLQEHYLPSATFLNNCVHLYFRHFYQKLPVVHAPTFRPSQVNTALFLSICSIWMAMLST